MTPPFFYQFAVFTPTYNRSHTLHRVYESLVAQTYSDFEWLVIDDGSADDTRSCIEAWQTIEESGQLTNGQLTKQKLTVRNPVGSLLLNQTLLDI